MTITGSHISHKGMTTRTTTSLSTSLSSMLTRDNDTTADNNIIDGNDDQDIKDNTAFTPSFNDKDAIIIAIIMIILPLRLLLVLLQMITTGRITGDDNHWNRNNDNNQNGNCEDKNCNDNNTNTDKR